MTRDQLKDSLKVTLANNKYFSDEDFNASIQDGSDEVSVYTGCILKAVRLPFVNNLSYYDFVSLIPDFYALFAIYSIPIKRWLVPDTVARFDTDTPDWDTRVGTPEFFAVINYRYTAIYKKPTIDNYGDMYVFYKARVGTLVGIDQLPVADQFSDTIESYVISDLWEQNQEWSKAQVHFTTYMNNVAALEKYLNSRQPERIPFLKEFKIY